MFKRIKARIKNISKRKIEHSVKKASKKQPKGAITFQYRMFHGTVDWKQVNQLKNKFKYTELNIFHGVAMRTEKGAVILTGPRGCGKTTLLRKLIQEKKVVPLEDGLVVVGKRNGKHFVVETGTYPWRELRADSKKISLIKGDQYTNSGPKKNIRPGEVFVESAFSETLAGAMLPNRSKQTYEPKEFPLKSLISVSLEGDLHTPIRITDKIEPGSANNLQSQVKNITHINPNQKRHAIVTQMEESILR